MRPGTTVEDRVMWVSHEGDAMAVERLSQREVEVMQLVAQMYCNQEIAEALYISEQTVRSHINRIFHKLNVHNRRQATRVALALGVQPVHQPRTAHEARRLADHYAALAESLLGEQP